MPFAITENRLIALFQYRPSTGIKAFLKQNTSSGVAPGSAVTPPLEVIPMITPSLIERLDSGANIDLSARADDLID